MNNSENNISLAEYIWLDGTEPTQTLRSKSRVISLNDIDQVRLEDFPTWGFDGSSTNQATGNNSDLILKPVRFCPDPIQGGNNYLVLCEVFSSDTIPHPTNTRSVLRSVLDAGGQSENTWLGFEQEYTLMDRKKPLGWPSNGYPEAQGPFYCGVGAERVYGREIVEKHTQACIKANLLIYGTNAEVMLGQWEYQIGYRGIDGEETDALTVSDHLWLARWLLIRVAEDYEISISLDNKPVKGDWNGAGCLTNFSTQTMRTPDIGEQAIEEAIIKLRDKHQQHVSVYGHLLVERLTGLHETCNLHEFRSGVSDRGASIRIPLNVKLNGYGYIEDRRPGANCDPYVVSARLITTICDQVDETVFSLQDNESLLATV